MGVPAFYRWLSEKYPKIVSAVLEKRNEVIEGTAIPLNLLEDNPNGVEYDNLYVDMNGLIHPCSHPEDREAPTSESEMYVNVTKYVDRLFAAVRPRKVLFLAIDGVAPRAKMNQQRSRRFRAVKDAKERQKVMDEVMQDMKDLGLQAPEGHGHEWDSNVITPGTEFMSNLSLYLRFYVLDRMNKNPAWRNIKVILSDASEPGEGEHKIMNFVRAQRAKPGYDPNQRHILHGLDADLIMLALATHEVCMDMTEVLLMMAKEFQHIIDCEIESCNYPSIFKQSSLVSLYVCVISRILRFFENWFLSVVRKNLTNRKDQRDRSS
jgi:5'-3' exoribonuclease 2